MGPVCPRIVNSLSLHMCFRLIEIGSTLLHGMSLDVTVCWRRVDKVIRLKWVTNNLPMSCVTFVVYRVFSFMRLRYEIWRFPKQGTFNFRYNLRVLTMVYNTQNHWICGLCPSSGIRNTKKHNVSETGPCFRSLVRGGGEIPSLLGHLEKAQLLTIGG
jgi:hypothetical protein